MSQSLAVSKKKLTPKQLQVLTALVAGNSYEGAANLASINTSTISGWMRDSLFYEEYRLGMERQRAIFESRMVALSNKAGKVVSDFLDSSNPEHRLEAAKISINSAVRLSARYKELQVQGFIQPAQPLVVFPEGTKLPWASKAPLPAMPELPEGIIDVDAEDVSDSEGNDE